jgi:predicted nucleotidyltransferase component of viral defense system
MNLFDYDRKFYIGLSDATGFHKDIIEKVHRLIIILEFINSNSFLREQLVLKGGTALNLTIFNMPRLSVDIDMDFHSHADRNTVLEERKVVEKLLVEHLERAGYRISPKSKKHASLDSLVAGYVNNAGNNDNIKIEINYSLRNHILPIVSREINTESFGEAVEVRTLSGVELLAAKTAALYNRLAARDFYDIYNVSKSKLISESEYDSYCRCVVFYRSLTSDQNTLDFTPARVDDLKRKTMIHDLYPMLVKGEHFELETAKQEVKEFLASSIILKSGIKEYIDFFYQGIYKPELLFSGEMLENIRNHPMAIWKTTNILKNNL